MSQEDALGHRRPISFFSSTLSPPQQRYSAGEREAWAIVAASRKWRKYLLAEVEIVVWTDHNPLAWMRKQKDPRGKYDWWILELEPLNYVVKYRKGAENLAADHLSRCPTCADNVVNNGVEYFEGNVYTLNRDLDGHGNEFPDLAKKILEAQRHDEMKADAIKQLQTHGIVASGQLKKFCGLKIRNGILNRRKKIVIPASLREISEMVHRSYHGGIQRTIQELKMRFYWGGMDADAESVQEVHGLFKE